MSPFARVFIGCSAIAAVLIAVTLGVSAAFVRKFLSGYHPRYEYAMGPLRELIKEEWRSRSPWATQGSAENSVEKPPPFLTPDEAANEIEAMDMERDWKYIVIHHSATEVGDMTSFDKEHRARGWDGAGYHLIIRNPKADEKSTVAVVEVTERWKQQAAGAHAGNREYDDVAIGICLVGDFGRSVPSAAQTGGLRKILLALQYKFSIDATRVFLHRDIRATECPGRHFPAYAIRRGLLAAEDITLPAESDVTVTQTDTTLTSTSDY